MRRVYPSLLALALALAGVVWAWRRTHAPTPCEVLGDSAGRLWVERTHPTPRIYADSLPDLATARRYEAACNREE